MHDNKMTAERAIKELAQHARVGAQGYAHYIHDLQDAALSELADLCAEVEALKAQLAKIASIAHAEKRVYDSKELDSWNEIRLLTLTYFNKSRS